MDFSSCSPEEILFALEKWSRDTTNVTDMNAFREAETNLLKFRNMTNPYDICIVILKHTNNPTVMMNALLTIKTAVMREYGNVLSADQCDALCVTLLTYVVEKVMVDPNFSTMVLNNLCHVLAIIHKRSWPIGKIDGLAEDVYINGANEPSEVVTQKSKDFALSLCRNIEQILQNPHQAVQKFGCLYARAVIQECNVEHCTQMNLNWSFHVYSHRRCESSLLQPLVTIMLNYIQLMYTYIEKQNYAQVSLDCLLYAISCINECLDWHFEEHLTTSYLLANNISKSDDDECDEVESTFIRPGVAWRQLLLHSNILILTRNLYMFLSNTRTGSDISSLYQFASPVITNITSECRKLLLTFCSLSGSIINNDSNKLDETILHSHLHDITSFLQLLVVRVTTYFNECHNRHITSFPKEYCDEIYDTCRVFNRLVSTYPYYMLCVKESRTVALGSLISYSCSCNEVFINTNTPSVPSLGNTMIDEICQLYDINVFCPKTSINTGQLDGYVCVLLYIMTSLLLTRPIMVEYGVHSVDTWGSDAININLATWSTICHYITHTSIYNNHSYYAQQDEHQDFNADSQLFVDLMGIQDTPGSLTSGISIQKYTSAFAHSISQRFIRMKIQMGEDEAARLQHVNDNQYDGDDVYGNCEIDEQFVGNSYDQDQLIVLAQILRCCPEFSLRSINETLLSYCEKLYNGYLYSSEESVVVSVFQESLYWLVSLSTSLLCDDGDNDSAMIPASLIQYSISYAETHRNNLTEDPLITLISTVFLLIEKQNSLLVDSFFNNSRPHLNTVIFVKSDLLSPYLMTYLLNFLIKINQAYLCPSIGIYDTHSPVLWQVLNSTESTIVASMVNLTLDTVQNMLLLWSDDAEIVDLTCSLLLSLMENSRVAGHYTSHPTFMHIVTIYRLACFSSVELSDVVTKFINISDFPSILQSFITKFNVTNISVLHSIIKLNNSNIKKLTTSVVGSIEYYNYKNNPCVNESISEISQHSSILFHSLETRTKLLESHACMQPNYVVSNNYNNHDESSFISHVITNIYILRGCYSLTTSTHSSVVFNQTAHVLYFIMQVLKVFKAKYSTLLYHVLVLCFDILEQQVNRYNDIYYSYVFIFVFECLQLFNPNKVTSDSHTNSNPHLTNNLLNYNRVFQLAGDVDNGLNLDDSLIIDTSTQSDYDSDDYEYEDNSHETRVTLTTFSILQLYLKIINNLCSRFFMVHRTPLSSSLMSSLPPIVKHALESSHLVTTSPYNESAVITSLNTALMKQQVVQCFALIIPHVESMIRSDGDDDSMTEYFRCLTSLCRTCIDTMVVPVDSSMDLACSVIMTHLPQMFVYGLQHPSDITQKNCYQCINFIAKRQLEQCKDLFQLAKGNRAKGTATEVAKTLYNSLLRHNNLSQLSQIGIYYQDCPAVTTCPSTNVKMFSIASSPSSVDILLSPMTSSFMLLNAQGSVWMNTLPLSSIVGPLLQLVFANIICTPQSPDVFHEAADSLYSLLTVISAIDDINIALETTQRDLQQKLVEYQAQHGVDIRPTNGYTPQNITQLHNKGQEQLILVGEATFSEWMSRNPGVLNTISEFVKKVILDCIQFKGGLTHGQGGVGDGQYKPFSLHYATPKSRNVFRSTMQTYIAKTKSILVNK